MTESNGPKVRTLTPLEYLQAQARKERTRLPKPPMVEPDAVCYAYSRPKAAFYTEGKAYQALVVAQQRRAAEGNPLVEKRFYKCSYGRNRSRLDRDHFHLTSMTTEDFSDVVGQEETDVHQD